MERLHDALWIHEDDGTLAGLRLRRRATVVQLAGGGLWVHSPTPLTPPFQSGLAAIDEVASLVAPNNGHCSWIGEWADAYPRAEIHVAEGVPTRRSKLRVDRIMSPTMEPRWASDFDQSTMVGAPLFDESVFLHKASRSLIVSDLIQNHNRSDQRGVGKLIARFASEPQGYKGLCLAHQLKRAGTIEDCEAFSKFLDTIEGWNFDRIIVAHGDVVEDRAREVLTDLLSSIRDGGLSDTK